MKLNFLKQEVASVHAAALVLGGAGMLSRVLGMLRDRLLAARFGAGRELDIYYAAFQIPDFMAVVFLLGGASAAVLPVFQEYLLEDTEKARRFIGALARWFLAASGAACLAAFFAVPFIVPFLAPGFDVRERHLAVLLTRIMLASPILLGLSGIFSTVVQSYRRFFVYAAAPIFYNIGIIAGVLFLAPQWGVPGLGAGVALGAALHLGVQWMAVRHLGYTGYNMIRYEAKPRSGSWSLDAESREGIRRVVVLAAPRVAGLSVSQATLLVLVALASALAPGSVAVFALAQNLYFVPIGIFGVSYAVALFPRMTHAALSGSGIAFFADLFSGVRSILFWVVPAAVLTIVLRAHIVRVALGGGVFSWEDTRLTAAVLAVLATGMAAGALQTLLIRGFYALGETWKPLVVNICAAALSIVLAVGCIRALHSAQGIGRFFAAAARVSDLPHPEALGLGLGFAAGLIADTAVLYWLLVRSAARRFGMKAPRIKGALMPIAAAAAAAGVIAYMVRASFSETLPLITGARVLAQGAAAALAGMGVYWVILSRLGSEDVESVRRSVKRRLFSVGILPREWDGDMTKS